MGSDYITLWTYQAPEVLKMILEDGIAYCDFKDDFALETQEFAHAYDWMCEQMKLRITPPESPNAKFPFWAWKYYNGKKEAKPRRTYDNMRPAQEAVFMELKIHKSRVLCSDFELWHFPLGGWSLSEEDIEDQKKKEEGWNLIFDESFNEPYFTGGVKWEDRPIQATFWCIKKEDVVYADLLQTQPGRKALKVKRIFKTRKCPLPTESGKRATNLVKATTESGNDNQIRK